MKSRSIKPEEFIEAARVPSTLKSQSFGLWSIYRKDLSREPIVIQDRGGFPVITFLSRYSLATMHMELGETVMEDSRRELSRHLPIWLAAKGRVLVSGLGLGCVVRGLLASPNVDEVTVIEIDRDILRIVGKEFQNNRRVRLIHGDALTAKPEGRFDCAWHDIHKMDETSPHLAVLHAKLIRRYSRKCERQGAWEFPRYMKRFLPRGSIG